MASKTLFCLALIFLAANPLRADEWEPSKTHAVIVGVLEWKHGLAPYPKRSRKDQELRDVLVKRGTPEKNIELILDEEATLSRIRESIGRALERAEGGSTLIVYYAGHGWAAGDDYCFANYEVEPAKKDTAWSLNELGATLAKDFKGQRAFFWADCCYSGGLEVVVDALAKKDVSAFSLTSAGTANASTNNWTFTQSIIDGLRGEPLVDADGDGRITLGELNAEVREAMQHMEGQHHGFKTAGLKDEFVLAASAGPRPKAAGKEFTIGSYVLAGSRWGRVIGGDGAKYIVQFYDYCDKRTEQFAPADLIASPRQAGNPIIRFDVGVKADCEVEWNGHWYDAKIVEKQPDRWRIHYLGYDASWDEWVDAKRIRFKK